MMDKARLIKWDDEECRSRGWEGGVKQLAEETGHPVEEVRDMWWIDDEEIDWGITPEVVGALEELTGHIIIRGRIYATTVPAIVIKRTDKEIVFETPDANLFF